MKRVGNLYNKIVDKDNLRYAIYRASEGKRYKKHVKYVIDDIDYYVDDLYNMLVSKSYIPSPFKEFKSYDANAKKIRVIKAPKFYPDQCIQWALMNVIEPIFTKGMYQYNCCNVKNRGTLYASKYIRHTLQDVKGTRYCLKLDIHHYFQSINKDILKMLLSTKIKDKDVLDLCVIIIDSNDEGLPLGNYTSQWFANFYLQNIDHYIKEQLGVKCYCRYMDDMVILHSNKKELHKILKQLQNELAKYDLTIKQNYQIFKVSYYDNKKKKRIGRPIDFVGFKHYREYTSIRKCIFNSFRRACGRVIKSNYNLHFCHSLISYHGYIVNTNSFQVQQKYYNKQYGVDFNRVKKVIRNERLDLEC